MNNKVLDRVRDLLPAIRARAADAELQRRVPDQSIRELTEAGVFRMLQPSRFGGDESSPVAFYEVIRAIATACPSTAWVSSVLGAHPWQLALFPPRAQEDVWGADPDTLVSSSYAPTGKLTPVDGGFEISGRWSFSSGCDHARWAFLGAVVPNDEGGADYLTVLVPRADYRIEDVWHVSGLSGTGSNDIVIEKAFVPAHRTYSASEQAELRGPGQEVNTAALYRISFGAVFSNTITAPIIGAAQGAYEAHIERMRERVRISYGGQKAAEDPFAHVRVARAASEIDAAILQMERNIGEQLRYAEAGEEIPLELRVRSRRDQVRGTERAIEAIDLLFDNSGGHAIRKPNPIERHWRDAHAGSVHVINDVERALVLYGRDAFGLPVTDRMI
ncbi:3-hydroxy-9,10-secoandrosta-1,3,5(10)-triene-9,17-dione monooxygenase oxygenase subunit [Nocardia implantans]|uniref:Flavin-dependent monooxygenase n=1 Tax=Nocardia implantans TaxID=3108168 RepID=A0ABU6ASD4_9NOCA|nr:MULTISPECIES: 3-hydroxy-9,10-secoandrosta-1,3,5(10)-triene-9,17-dione monooxygenase oxygenase subunit [unclassified Nocardia]MBF6191828.1 flavin-dependent monooxygenase [Nocardia beijingensis]MEA3527860.1 flavin-dependent monooxygenase [Nocardia sp. CDC192]MEB3510388.1 flavin-dependent monooxygenase [Nocardia sp. CDC186]